MSASSSRDKSLANLRSFADLPVEERRAIALKGGLANAKRCKEKKLMKDVAKAFLNLAIKKGKQCDVEDLEYLEAIKGKNITVQEAIVFSQVQKALEGDRASAEFLRDTAGEKIDKVEIDLPVPIFEGEDDLK